jgi:hypothetical protein
MDKGMSCCGAANYLKSRQCAGGHEMSEHHNMKSSMNKEARDIVNKSGARQMSKRDAQIAKDPREKAIYADLKSSKKPGGM